ncbi:MAG: M13 family metallopeptidase [Candidatus Saccharibacteria bacterium]|nr:M13 family metallopeptidase [Candidatus Saccharibacteria bacterium]
MLINTNKDLPSYIKLNHQIRPQDNFYAYVCHHWALDNPLPATEPRWSLFHKLHQDVKKQVEQIIKQWLKNSTDLNQDQAKVIKAYQAFLNKNDQIEQSFEILNNLKADLLKLQALPNSQANLLAKASQWQINFLFNLNVELDSKNNRRYCLLIEPGHLHLDGRDYYLSDDPQLKQIRQTYVDFLKKYQKELQQANFQTKASTEEFLNLEILLATKRLPLDEARRLDKTYNLFAWSDFQDQFPFDWVNYFKALNLKLPKEILVSDTDYLKSIIELLVNLSDQQLIDYLSLNLGLQYAGFCHDKFYKALFNFFSKTLYGYDKMESLKKRAIAMINRDFSDIIGKEYVRQHFSETDRQQAQLIADLVQKAFRKRLGDNGWMSEISRDYAQKKLDNIIINLGYSQYWADYTNLELTDNPLQNHLNIQKHYQQFEWTQLLHQTPNRHRFGEFSENIQTVNAWTNLVLLNTNYPVGYLQPPLYDPKASQLYNLGGLGTTIGHELTHNFDDQGSLYDHSGHLNSWLTTPEHRGFKKQALKLIKLANKHYYAPKIKMKGKNVIGEIIADLGGLEIVLEVVKQQITNPKILKQALRNIFTSYAFQYASNESLESKQMSSQTYVHPDPVFRVNGVIRHCDDFYKAFDVQPSDNLYLAPKHRAKIW